MSYSEHQKESEGIVARCAIVTVSDTRTEFTDTTGDRIRKLLVEAGHSVGFYCIVHDEPAELGMAIDQCLVDDKIDVILTNGGTGISPRDRTIEVIEPRIKISLPGFGELFRMLSFGDIESGAMLSRATGGIASGKLIFSMPGSTKAVELAMTKLIIPQIRHILGQMRKTGK